jgi:Skp family chaperone for outer membrane proteins
VIKKNRLFVASVFLLGASVLPALAQTRPATPAPAPTSGPVAQSKIALIFSDFFQDPKTGIARINATMNALNREFQPRQTELNQTAQKIQQLQDEITKAQQGNSTDAKALQAKIDLLDQTKKDYQRKGEDATAAYNKRKQAIFAPLQEDISKALEAYARAHGISVLIDGSAVPLAYAADAIDVTRPFINDYNSKNPATAELRQPQ